MKNLTINTKELKQEVQDSILNIQDGINKITDDDMYVAVAYSTKYNDKILSNFLLKPMKNTPETEEQRNDVTINFLFSILNVGFAKYPFLMEIAFNSIINSMMSLDNVPKEFKLQFFNEMIKALNESSSSLLTIVDENASETQETVTKPTETQTSEVND